jgi:hypothetical protein
MGGVGDHHRDRLTHIARAAGGERHPARPVDLVERIMADDHRRDWPTLPCTW